MKEMQITATIAIKTDGEIIKETTQTKSIPFEDSDTETDHTFHSEDDEITEDEAERYAVASDLADVCEYLEDSEVIRIKLIIQKAQERKERARVWQQE